MRGNRRSQDARAAHIRALRSSRPLFDLRSPTARCARRRAALARGFTLIEVMAAVFILGLVVASISTMLVQSRRSDGYTRLRAQAAALADLEIAKIEEGLLRGAAPPLGASESGESPWIVSVEVTAFDPSALAPPAAEDDARGGAAAQAPEGSWLASAAAQQQPPLREIRVRVSWEGAPVDVESGEPDAVERRTFAIDPAALEALAEAESAEGEGSGDEGEGEPQ
jgi:prepilin-type N-terminal cleavage/methylation domain-containing protein